MKLYVKDVEHVSLLALLQLRQPNIFLTSRYLQRSQAFYHINQEKQLTWIIHESLI